MTTKPICVRPRFTEKKLPLGSSKFLGNPDVWKGFSWPEYYDGEEWYLMDFICQIDCQELASLDSSGLFPKTGLLYFFYPLEEPPFSLQEASPVCYYYNGSKEDLEEVLVQFDDGSFFGSQEQRLEFCPDQEDTFVSHHLLGEALLTPIEDAEELENKLLLLELCSFETADRKVSFWDDGTLQFYVDPQKLKQGDVSAVKARLITT